MEARIGLIAAAQQASEPTLGALEGNPKLQRMMSSGITRSEYERFLRDLYHVVWHFNPVCAAAASRLDDHFRGARYYLYEHMLEERGHEEMILSDMAAIGLSREEERLRRPTIWAATTVAYNYFAVERHHPMAAFGMLYSLERIASKLGGAMAAVTRRSLQLDETAGTRFLSSHSTLDVEHLAKLEQLLGQIADPDASDSIVETLRVNDSFFLQTLHHA